MIETGIGTIRELVEDYPDVLDEMLDLLADRQRQEREDAWRREHSG